MYLSSSPSSQLSGAAGTRSPHLHGLYRHPSRVSLPPRRQPLVSIIPEGPLGIGRRIDPRLAALTIATNRAFISFTCCLLLARRLKLEDLLEPSVPGSDSNVQDEIEFLVERRIARCARSICPRVGKESVVLRLLGEAPLLPQGPVGVELRVEDLSEPVVEIHVNVFVRPAVGVSKKSCGR